MNIIDFPSTHIETLIQVHTKFFSYSFSIFFQGEKKKSSKKSHSRDPKRDRGINPQLGKYKDGVLKLSKKDLAKITR